MTDDDDDLLHTLGALERERDDAVEAWEALARGERTRDDVVASRLAAGESPEDAEHIVSLVSPRGSTSRDWVEIGARAFERDPEPSEADGSTPTPLVPRRRSVRWWAGGAVLLAAALAVLWFSRPRASDPALPGYTLVVRNETVRAVRGQVRQVGADRYRADSDVFWVVRPREAVAGALEVGVVAEGRTEETRILVPPSVAVEINERGVVQIRGRFGVVFPLPPGAWEVRVLVGRHVPTSVEELEAGGPWSTTPPLAIEVLP